MFRSCSIEAKKPRGGKFHEDNIQWLPGHFRWQLIEDFLEEVAKIDAYKIEHLKLQNVYGYVNKRPHHLTPDKVASFQRSIQGVSEDQLKLTPQKRKALDISILVSYVVDQEVLSEIQSQPSQPPASQRRGRTPAPPRRELPTEVGRFTVKADLDNNNKVIARKANILLELRRHWQCELGSSCAAYNKGGICYQEGQNIAQNHWLLKEEELRFWRDEIIVDRSTVMRPSAGVLIKLKQARRNGAVKKKEKINTTSNNPQWSSPG
ncbi:MAG: hypothetical protein EOO61_21175 [Hymenobacter sp.]|nr:MAG: hypothetical protein EOO61_21175 [Hymenobacter sp.]